MVDLYAARVVYPMLYVLLACGHLCACLSP